MRIKKKINNLKINEKVSASFDESLEYFKISEQNFKLIQTINY